MNHDIYQCLKIITQVHGQNHPELNEVLKTYEAILNDTHNKELYKQLKHITHDFKTPDDACETYQKVYHELNKEYEIIVKEA